MKICSSYQALAFSYYYYNNLLEALCSIDFTGRSVLDLGCGYGDILNFIKEKNPLIKHVEGQDLNNEKITKARRDFPDIKFYVKDGNEFQYQDYPHIDTILLLGIKLPGALFTLEFLNFFCDFLSKPGNILYYNPVINDIAKVGDQMKGVWVQEPAFLKALIETSSFNFDIRLVKNNSSLLEIKNLKLTEPEKNYLKTYAIPGIF